MEHYPLKDRAAMQVEITRLRRIESKADSSIREAIARRIRELQRHVETVSLETKARGSAA